VFFHQLAAWNARDWETVRELWAEDFTIADHRALSVMDGLGRERYVESIRAQAELAPDVVTEMFRVLAIDHHGSVTMWRTSGTYDGGAFVTVA
jgi:hypothetical protein